MGCFSCGQSNNSQKVQHRAVSRPAPVQPTQSVNPIAYSPNKQAQQARLNSDTQKRLRQRTADNIQKKYR